MTPKVVKPRANPGADLLENAALQGRDERAPGSEIPEVSVDVLSANDAAAFSEETKRSRTTVIEALWDERQSQGSPFLADCLSIGRTVVALGQPEGTDGPLSFQHTLYIEDGVQLSVGTGLREGDAPELTFLSFTTVRRHHSLATVEVLVLPCTSSGLSYEKGSWVAGTVPIQGLDNIERDLNSVIPYLFPATPTSDDIATMSSSLKDLLIKNGIELR